VAEPGFDRRFPLVVVTSLAYFVAIGVLVPVLPRYVEDSLDGGGAAVGMAVGSFAIAAAFTRPVVGRLGDTAGRRVLVVGGCLVAALSIAAYGLPGGLAALVLLRLVTGVGEAAMFVGAATTAQDLAPPSRRGQAASLFSIAIYGGLGIGPPLGEWVYQSHGADTAWTVAAISCLVGAGFGCFLPRGGGHEPAARRRGLHSILHPAARRPGVILALSATGFAGFGAFVPLYVDEIGMSDAGAVLTEYAVIILAVRILGSRLPDVLGSRRGPLAALVFQAAGLAVMAAWAEPVGLYVATAVFAAGVSLLYPALFPVVVDGAPDSERSQAIATFTLFFDTAMGLGAPALGVVVALTNERGAFLAAAGLAVVGFVLHRSSSLPARPEPEELHPAA
jgi:MFS family permease